MRLSKLFAVLAVAGLAMIGGNAPASAASAGAAFAPSATQLADQVSPEVIQVGRRCWWSHGYLRCSHYRRRHHRYHGHHYRRRHHYGHRRHYRRHHRHHY